MLCIKMCSCVTLIAYPTHREVLAEVLVALDDSSGLVLQVGGSNLWLEASGN